MFFERLWTRADKPAVILADDVEAVAIERGLDARPAEGDDKSIVRGRASVVRIHCLKFPNCPAPAGLFFVVADCCYAWSRGFRSPLGRGASAGSPALRPIVGSERTHRASSSVSINVDRPSLRAVNSLSLIALNIRVRVLPVAAAASIGVYVIRLSGDLDSRMSVIGASCLR
jgi:hypothetical protein